MLEKRALLTEQLRRDPELLKQANVMDYSLLIGIHNLYFKTVRLVYL
jgi:1-phosphatidylinositol-4-phosphate 5-kinase